MRYFIFTLFGCLLFFAFTNSKHFGDSLPNSWTQLQIEAGEDIYLVLGDSSRIEVQMSRPLSEIESIAWEPSTNLGCSNCYDPFVSAPTNSDQICYTVTVTDIDACVATDEICVFIATCDENAITDNFLNDIMPAPSSLDEMATLDLQLYNTQFVDISLYQNNDLAVTLIEKWYKKGWHNIELDLANVPDGTYNLVLDLYPENIIQTITINHLVVSQSSLLLGDSVASQAGS